MINIKGYIFYPNKNVFSSLISIFGIGKYKAMYICKTLKIDFFKKNKFLSADDIKNISDKLSFFKIGDVLKRYVKNNIIKLIDIKCYKGIRHKKKLPVRGQNTKNNARTRRGPKKIIFFKGVKNVKINKKSNKKK